MKNRDADSAISKIATSLVAMRARSRLTQAQVAVIMGTTQTSIARLERGQQSPTLRTLRGYALANGFGLEIGFVHLPSNDRILFAFED